VKVYFDTTVLVAASVNGHPNHIEAETALRAVHAKRLDGHIGAHGSAEFYSVLTRTPFVPPIYPSEAWQLLAENILPHFEIVTLSAKDYEETIRSCAKHGWVGGKLYDALHIRCASKSACVRIYTFNVRHFQQLAPELTDRITVPLPV